MKRNVLLSVALLPLFALAQSRDRLDSLARNTLTELMNTWSLGISDTVDLDIETYNKFKKLFDSSGAFVQDDLNVMFTYKRYKKGGVYKAGSGLLPFDIYAHDLALAVQIKNIPKDSELIADSASRNPAERLFKLRRDVEFQKAGRYVMPDNFTDAVIGSRIAEPENDILEQAARLGAGIKKSEDSLYQFLAKETWLVTMAYDSVSDVFRIKEIKVLSNEVKCLNDADNDGIPDNQDSLLRVPGDFTADGKPDYDLDGIPDSADECMNIYGMQSNKGCPVDYFYTRRAFDVFVGGQFSLAQIHLPEPNQLGFDAVESASPLWKKGTLKNPGLQPGAQAGGNIVWYFGQRRKRAGVSAGVRYAGFTASYSLENAMRYTFKAVDAGNDSYRRQITISSLQEEMNYKVFAFPLLFNYRWHPGKKNSTVFKVQAGPSLVYASTSSGYNANIDFGGIYQVGADNAGNYNHIVYEPFDPASIHNVYFTADSINAKNKVPGAGAFFENLHSIDSSYDFADITNYKGTDRNMHRLAAAFSIGLDLQQKISEGLTIKIGAEFIYAPLPERKSDYQPINHTGDSFHSLYRSPAKTYYSAYGLNIGIVYNW